MTKTCLLLFIYEKCQRNFSKTSSLDIIEKLPWVYDWRTKKKRKRKEYLLVFRERIQAAVLFHTLEVASHFPFQLILCLNQIVYNKIWSEKKHNSKFNLQFRVKNKKPVSLHFGATSVQRRSAHIVYKSSTKVFIGYRYTKRLVHSIFAHVPGSARD